MPASTPIPTGLVDDASPSRSEISRGSPKEPEPDSEESSPPWQLHNALYGFRESGAVFLQPLYPPTAPDLVPAPAVELADRGVQAGPAAA